MNSFVILWAIYINQTIGNGQPMPVENAPMFSNEKVCQEYLNIKYNPKEIYFCWPVPHSGKF